MQTALFVEVMFLKEYIFLVNEHVCNKWSKWFVVFQCGSLGRWHYKNSHLMATSTKPRHLGVMSTKQRTFGHAKKHLPGQQDGTEGWKPGFCQKYQGFGSCCILIVVIHSIIVKHFIVFYCIYTSNGPYSFPSGCTKPLQNALELARSSYQIITGLFTLQYGNNFPREKTHCEYFCFFEVNLNTFYTYIWRSVESLVVCQGQHIFSFFGGGQPWLSRSTQAAKALVVPLILNL